MKKSLLVLKYFSNKKNYTKARSFCLQQFGNNKQAAEDALHDIIMKFVSKADNLKFPTDARQIEYFILRTIKNRVLDEARKKKVRNFVDLMEGDLEPENLNAVHLEKFENLKLIMEEIKSKFTAQQLELWKCIYLGKTVEEMEELLNRKASTIYTLKEKLFKKMSRLIDENDLY